MTAIQLELDDELVELLRRSEQPVAETARELIVFELYRRGDISSGKGADLLGIDRVQFLANAASLGIDYFRLNEDEIRSELDAASRI